MFITAELVSETNGTMNQLVTSKFQDFPDPDLKCGTDITTASIVYLDRDIKALESELDCKSDLPIRKMKSYIVSSQGVLLLVGYSASSDELYERFVPEFDESVKKMQLDNSTNFSDAAEYAKIFGLTFGQKQFEVNGTIFTIDFASNPPISDLQLDEKAKRVSFNVVPLASDNTSSNRTGEWQTFIRINDLLYGPYTITVDGKPDVENQAILVIQDHTIGRSTTSAGLISNDNDIRSTYLIIGSEGDNMTAGYSNSSGELGPQGSRHTVVIVGTSVVPEFSGLFVAISIAIAIGTAVGIPKIYRKRK